MAEGFSRKFLMRGYFKYYSYYYDADMLQLTVNGTILDPVYLNVEKVVMLHSSGTDVLIILHKNLNIYQLSKLQLDDFTLSWNITISREHILTLNAIEFGSHVIVGLGVASGFKLVKISPQTDHVCINDSQIIGYY